MAFITKGFLMPSNNPDQEEQAQLYTLPSFKLSKDKIHFHNIFYDEEKKKWIYRNINGHDIFLSEEEVIRLVGCRMCGKPKVNNWRRYCSPNCPYYFNTLTLEELLIIDSY